eukprot:SAG11_NODE_24172_length_377_cov_0.733813_2_plen_52_part_01
MQWWQAVAALEASAVAPVKVASAITSDGSAGASGAEGAGAHIVHEGATEGGV